MPPKKHKSGKNNNTTTTTIITTTTNKKRYTSLTNEQKRALCEYFQQNPTLTQQDLIQWVKDTFGAVISQSTCSYTLKQSYKYINGAGYTDPNQRRQRKVQQPTMDARLAAWFNKNQERLPISGDVLKIRAKQLLEGIDHDLKLSNGWLSWFKIRNRIASFKRHGESGSVDEALIRAELPRLRAKLDHYEWENIYNMDETGLYYRMEPDTSLANKRLKGKKKRKERITVGLCCNGTGTHKLKPIVIGTGIKMRCFKNIRIPNLGCDYYYNKKAWMTSKIFAHWIQGFDIQMRQLNKRALLILDNFSGHRATADTALPHLENTDLYYLPPNTTSVLQPLDAGIIAEFKVHYRRRQTLRTLNRIEDINSIFQRRQQDEIFNIQRSTQSLPDKPDEPGYMTVKDAIMLVVESWKDVGGGAKPTIQNCFRHCKTRSEGSVDEVGQEDLVNQEAVAQLQAANARLHHASPMDIATLLNDESIAVELGEDIFDEEEEEEETLERRRQKPIGEEIDSDDDDDSSEAPKVLISEAAAMLESLELFFQQQDGDYLSTLALLRKIKVDVDTIRDRSFKQSSIYDFFSPTRNNKGKDVPRNATPILARTSSSSHATISGTSSLNDFQASAKTHVLPA